MMMQFRFVGLYLFATGIAVLAMFPVSSSAQIQKTGAPATKAEIFSLYESKNYAAALAAQRNRSRKVELAEVASTNAPGIKTAETLGNLAWYALAARAFSEALLASNKALVISPDLLWLHGNRAHALLFLGRKDEARAVYLMHKGKQLAGKNSRWETVIVDDFIALEKLGLKNQYYTSIAADLGFNLRSKIILKEAVALLAKGVLHSRAGRYTKAELLYKRSLAMHEKVLGPNHSDVGAVLYIIAMMYQNQKRYAEAEPLYKRALHISDITVGPDHPSVATPVNNLAELYRIQRRYAEAEPLYKRALAITQKVLGPEHPELATVLNNLALLYDSTGRYIEADPHFKRALTIREKALGPNHPHVVQSLNNLAALYTILGRFSEAEPLHKRALAIRENTQGKSHPSVAESLNNLAVLYFNQGRFSKAEPLYKRSLSMTKKASGPDHRDVGTLLNSLAVLYRVQGRFSESELLCKRALAVRKKALGSDHPDLASSLNTLAKLYRFQGRYAEAKLLHKRALAIHKKALGPDHPDVGQSLNNLAEVYRLQGRYGKAEPLYKRALAIREKALGPNHPDVGQSLSGLTVLYEAQGRHADTEAIHKRIIAISKKSLGADHINVAISLNNLAALYQTLNRYDDAEPLYKRALTIQEKALGPGRPGVFTTLNNLAHLYQAQGRNDNAERFYKRALGMTEKNLELDNSSIATLLRNLVSLYEKRDRPAEVAKLRKRLAHMPEPGSRHIEVFFGTNRKLAKTAELSFGNGYSKTLSFGRVIVQVPKAEVANRAKRIGQGLGQAHKAKAKLSSSAVLKLKTVNKMSAKNIFAKSVLKKLAKTAIYKKQALVFIHGYNVTFSEAIKRAGQIGFDLEFDGALMVYTWPSSGQILNYFYDARRADASARHLVSFLDMLAGELPGVTLHVLAHSMGNRVLTAALKQMSDRKSNKQRPYLGEIIMAHADIPIEICKNLVKQKHLARGYTLYINADDWALWLSKWIRLGASRCGSRAVVYNGVDTIDTTGMGGKAGVATLISGNDHHGVFANDPLLFGEITRLLLMGQRPAVKRTPELKAVVNKSGKIYWKYDSKLSLAYVLAKSTK